MNIERVIKNQSNPIVSLTWPTGDDAITVKLGFPLEQQNMLYFLQSETCLAAEAKAADIFVWW